MADFYRLLRPLAFALEPEVAHHAALGAARIAERFGIKPFAYTVKTRPVRVMGLDFPSPVGLAAGLDKNGEYIDALAALGFGFIEIGTITPRPQSGNPKPRLFRLPEAEAIINRMGFNNHGVDALIANVKRARYRGILGINIGKNFDTPIEKAVDDYLYCLRRVYPYASYITVNISSPNTANLRQLQSEAMIGGLLERLKEEQRRLIDTHQRYVPLAVKIAPDMTDEQIVVISEAFLQYKVDAVIATNTTISRQGVENLADADQQGGLSGAPLMQRSTEVVRQLHRILGEEVPIIAAGGIMSGADALAKINAGAKLVQLYTGLIYRGPKLINDIYKVLCGVH
ncbi:MAG: quinone-dependent dihydroorotate dehydrogenase [Gammaproteobacteria bacterium]|nr:quinone-dependent dihydroorotate dehydrogenase [Gammaproteobacteria bacterium]